MKCKAATLTNLPACWSISAALACTTQLRSGIGTFGITPRVRPCGLPCAAGPEVQSFSRVVVSCDVCSRARL